MNDLLLNREDGPSIIENMSIEQLTGDSPYETTHSSESDAARRRIDNNGLRSSGSDIFGFMPD